jgi:hypothetical protein
MHRYEDIKYNSIEVLLSHYLLHDEEPALHWAISGSPMSSSSDFKITSMLSSLLPDTVAGFSKTKQKYSASTFKICIVSLVSYSQDLPFPRNSPADVRPLCELTTLLPAIHSSLCRLLCSIASRK